MAPVCLFVNPGVRSRLGQPRTGKPWMAPLTLIELAAMIPSHWEARIWDESVQGPISPEQISGCNLVALSGLTPSRYRAEEIAVMAQEAGIPLIAGGRDVIGWSRESGGTGRLLELYPSICTTDCNKALMSEIISDTERGKLKPHYALPTGTPAEFGLPRRDLINPKDYFAGWTLRSSQGCENKCAWCTVGGCGYYLKPPVLLEQELTQIKQGGGWFCLDVADSFGGNFDFVMGQVLPLYRRSGLRWGTEAAVDDLLRGTGLIEPMAKAGCCLIYIGIESLKRNLHKKSSRETVEEVIRRCRKVGILVIGSFIIDAHGDETVEEIGEMVAWAARWLDFAQFSLVALLPGTTLRKVALQHGTIISQNPEDNDGAHSTRFHILSPKERSRLLEKAYTDFSPLWRVVWRALRAPIPYNLPVFYAGLRYRKGIPH